VIFLDTSAIYALADSGDRNHLRAVELFRQVLDSGEIILTQSYILVEAAALLQHRLGLASALQFLQDAEAFETHWVTSEDHRAGTDLLAERGQRQLSLVDCVSFLVMRQRGARQALAFDEDFEREGFIIYPGHGSQGRAPISP
jgi:hypothetical protein